MRYRYAAALLLTIGCAHGSAERTTAAAQTLHLDGRHDAALATSLGADAHGMRPYVVAFLEAGPHRDQSDEEAVALGRAHMANIRRMADEGSLVLAGPFMDDGTVRGLYVFAVSTVDEARALTETDPAIQAGRLQMALHPWYGTAALGLLPDLHQKLEPPDDAR